MWLSWFWWRDYRQTMFFHPYLIWRCGLPLTTIMMATIFQKEQLCLVMPVRLNRHSSCLLWSPWLGSWCTTRRLLKNPMEYRPERQLNPDMSLPDLVVFGFGRRSVNVTYSVRLSCRVHTSSHRGSIFSSICPERYFSNDSACLLTSCLLAAYQQLMIRETSTSSNPSSPVDYCRKHN